MRWLVDDTGRTVEVPDAVTRVVSLVPSLTESVAATAPGLLVGATDWCTHPADLDVVRVRGTKNPDVALVVDLAPDLVLTNSEENRTPDLDLLRAAGVPVWETDIRTLFGAHPALGPDGSLARMLDACGLGRPDWLRAADDAWAAVEPASPRRRSLVPIWRRPWMAVGRDTFTGDVLARLGVDNVLADDAERYPKVELDGLADRVGGFDLVVLPDEPYLFTVDDGPEAFPGTDVALVPGRLLTWYGPSLVDAARDLPGLLAAAGRR